MKKFNRRQAPFVDRSELFEAIYKDKHLDRTRRKLVKTKKGSPAQSTQWRLFTHILRGDNHFVKVKDNDIRWNGDRSCQIRFLVSDGVLIYPEFELKSVKIK